MLAISKSNAMFFKHQDYERRLSTLKISQESVDGLIFRGGGWGGVGEVEEGDHLSSEGFQMQKSQMRLKM